MLILTRKEKETIHIGDVRVVVTVLRVAGNRVDIGIEAPRNIVILRGELNSPMRPESQEGSEG